MPPRHPRRSGKLLLAPREGRQALDVSSPASRFKRTGPRSVRVELAVFLCHAHQQLGRGEALAVGGLQLLEAGHHLLAGALVGVAERTAAEGWEADAEDGADVAVAGAADDAFVQAAGGFVDH